MKKTFLIFFALLLLNYSELFAIKTGVLEAARQDAQARKAEVPSANAAAVMATPAAVMAAHPTACEIAHTSIVGSAGDCDAVVTEIDEVHNLVDGADHYHDRAAVSKPALVGGREKPLKEKLTVFHKMVAKTLADFITTYFLADTSATGKNAWKVQEPKNPKNNFNATNWRDLLLALGNHERFGTDLFTKTRGAYKGLTAGFLALYVFSFLEVDKVSTGKDAAALAEAIEKRLWVMDVPRLLQLCFDALDIDYKSTKSKFTIKDPKDILKRQLAPDSTAVAPKYTFTLGSLTLEDTRVAQATAVLNKMFGHP